MSKWFLAVLTLVFLSYGIYLPPAHSDDTGETKTFQLYATDGYFTLPDGQKMYVWGYSLKNEKGTAEFPAPKLEVNEGDQVEVTLTNIGPLNENMKQLAHTIHWHGLDTDQANDGVPHTSPAVQVGESVTYHFTANHAGTYFYHCHVDTVEHLQMGMYGAFIVKAKDGAKQAWTEGPGYDKEYVFLLNEIDPLWHRAVELGTSYDRTSFHPRYWTINGKAYPDTENDPDTAIDGKVGDTVLIRLINSGYNEHSFHMHGHHFQVIASDGRPLVSPMEKDTINLGPGERYDLLVTFTQEGHFPFHSHNIIDNTNNGVYPGGLHTMVRVASAGQAVQQDTLEHTGHGGSKSGDQGGAGASHSEGMGAVPAVPPAESSDSSEKLVYIDKSTFSEKELYVKKGTKVTWINLDTQIHTVIDLKSRFKSGNMLLGDRWSYIFDQTGTYIYYCSTHPSMEAKIIVE